MALYPHSERGYWEYGTQGYPIVGGYDDAVIEDFEHGSLSAYGGDTGSFRIQGTNVLQGRSSLESTAEHETIGTASGIPTPRTTTPTEYRCRMVMASDGHASLLTNVQSTSWPFRNCYALSVDAARNELRLFSRESSNTRYLERKTVSIAANREYRPAITLTPERINGKLYDRGGSLIAETESYRDTTHSGGGLGFYNGNGRTAYYDYATERAGSMGDVSRVVLNDFEDGNLSEFRVVGGGSSGTQSVTPTAALKGKYGLEMVDFGSIHTLPGMGAPGYIRDGQPISFRYNFRQIGDEQYYFIACPQSATSDDNRYRLEFLMTGGFRLRKTSGGSTNTLEGSSSEGRAHAACYNLSYSSGRWYNIVLSVDSTDGLRADLYQPNGSRMGWISAPETQFISSTNGYGHYCSGGGHYYADEIIEHQG